MSSFKPEFVPQAEKLCRLGATDADIAAFFEVSVRTIYRWKSENDAFCQATIRGKDLADSLVEERLFQRATGYSHDATKIMQFQGKEVLVPYVEHYPPDTAAAVFWLKNRRPDLWRDKQEHELAGPGGGAIALTWLPPQS